MMNTQEGEIREQEDRHFDITPEGRHEAHSVRRIPYVEGTRPGVGPPPFRKGDHRRCAEFRGDRHRHPRGAGAGVVPLPSPCPPADGKLGLLARFSKGTLAYISGLIGKLAPESVRFETPVASIGIRGTYFAVKGEEPPS